MGRREVVVALSSPADGWRGHRPLFPLSARRNNSGGFARWLVVGISLVVVLTVIVMGNQASTLVPNTKVALPPSFIQQRQSRDNDPQPRVYANTPPAEGIQDIATNSVKNVLTKVAANRNGDPLTLSNGANEDKVTLNSDAPTRVLKSCTPQLKDLNVEGLDLSGCALEAIPPHLEAYTSIRLLDASDNKLTTWPLSLRLPPMTEVVFLSGNAFSHLPAIPSNQQLRVVSLRHNRLTDLNPSVLPPTLEQLILTDNSIESIQQGLATHKLHKIMLARNRLTQLPLDFHKQTQLELLRLSHNQLTSLPTELYNMPRLTWVALSGNPVLATSTNRQKQPAARIPAPLIQLSDLTTGNVLGEGTSGLVKAGNLNGKTVAIKFFKSSSSDGDYQDEMAIAASLQHPNITAVVATLQGDTPALVFEQLSIGFKPLAHPPNAWHRLRCTYDTSLPWLHVVRLLHAVSSAMEYIHKQKIFHGDLYAHNIMYNPTSGEAKLGDFGASWSYEMIPEQHHNAIQRLEVRAFGLLVQELVEVTSISSGAQGHNKERLLQLAMQCMSTTTSERPLFAQLSVILRSMTH
eukprot:m.86806 g.86806  ORF g.86806 m.86806 type:complete len:576 (+) comp12815_c0_seq2:308-2035(+)